VSPKIVRSLIRNIALIFVTVAACAETLGFARADVLELKNGGRVEGQLADSKDGDQTSYVITTADGGQLTIARSEVARVVPQTKDEEEYQRRARAAADTVDAHWDLAQWCREKNLRNAYREQLAHILELDPQHPEARQALGYQKANGQWMLRDDIMAARGLVLYDGKYVTRQHVELLERDKQARSTDADWNNRIDRLRRGLTGRRQDRADQALVELRAIRDPQAAAAITDWLRHEQDPELKRILLETTAQIDHPLALNALVELSLSDPDDETRAQALEYLIKSGRPGVAGAYIRALKSGDDNVINHAAEALQTIGDTDTIGPLIDALVVKRKGLISGGGSPDQHAYVFTPKGGGGGVNSFGSAPPKIVTQTIRNPFVLTALVKLSGGTSFEYDQEQWRTWLAAQAKSRAVDLRRDQ
jgi:HEAT repeats